MGRIGSPYAQSRIFDLNTRDYQPAFEPYTGQNAMVMMDDPNRMPMQLSHAPFQNNYIYNNTNATSFHDIKNRLKRINNKTEYQKKVGKRVEGLAYSEVLAKPYLNVQENMENFTVPEKLQNLSPAEQYKASVSIPKVLIAPTHLGSAVEFNLKTQPPYEIDELNNMSPMEFIQGGHGKNMIGLSKNNAMDINGSNIKFNNAIEADKPVYPKTGFENYKSYLENKKTRSGINARQIDNLKSRQILGTYNGNPSGGRVPSP